MVMALDVASGEVPGQPASGRQRTELGGGSGVVRKTSRRRCVSTLCCAHEGCAFLRGQRWCHAWVYMEVWSADFVEEWQLGERLRSALGGHACDYWAAWSRESCDGHGDDDSEATEPGDEETDAEEYLYRVFVRSNDAGRPISREALTGLQGMARGGFVTRVGCCVRYHVLNVWARVTEMLRADLTEMGSSSVRDVLREHSAGLAPGTTW